MIEPMALFPLHVTENLHAQKAFYERVFGLQAVFFQPDFYVHLLHPGSGVQLGFMVPDHPEQPPFLHPVAGTDGTVITVEVADVRAAHASAREMDLELALELKSESWGQTHFMVRDPGGLVVDVVEHRAPAAGWRRTDTRPREWRVSGRRAARKRTRGGPGVDGAAREGRVSRGADRRWPLDGPRRSRHLGTSGRAGGSRRRSRRRPSDVHDPADEPVVVALAGHARAFARHATGG